MVCIMNKFCLISKLEKEFSKLYSKLCLKEILWTLDAKHVPIIKDFNLNSGSG